MLDVTIVTTENELMQVHQLNRLNLRSNVDAAIQKQEGFVTWLYSVELLIKMHQLAPSIIVKDGNKVIGYALATLKETQTFHPDLSIMFKDLECVQYENKPLSCHNFYCMGQICIAKEYRGQGIFVLLYQKHKEVYSSQYDFILTEISTGNSRSLRAHQKAGFQTIYTYSDEKDEWNVVVWDWS